MRGGRARQILRRVLRRCPGQPEQVLESTREETVSPLPLDEGFGYYDGDMKKRLYESLEKSFEPFREFSSLFGKIDEELSGMLGGGFGSDFGRTGEQITIAATFTPKTRLTRLASLPCAQRTIPM